MMLEDPGVNLAISQRGCATSHLGIQVEDAAELAEVYARLRRAERSVLATGLTTRCYAHSQKQWIRSPGREVGDLPHQW